MFIAPYSRHQIDFQMVRVIGTLRSVGNTKVIARPLRFEARGPLVEVIATSTCVAIPGIYGLTPPARILIFYIALFIHIVFVVFIYFEKLLVLNGVVLQVIQVAVVVPIKPSSGGLSIWETYLRPLSDASGGFGMLLVVPPHPVASGRVT